MSTHDVRIEKTDREITMSREYDAPRELVWRAWTDPAELARWWGPSGFRTTTHSHRLAAGGEWRFTMHGPDGHDYENHIAYDEVRAPERLAYQQGGDVEGEAVSFSVVVTIDELPGKRTRVTMKSLFPSAKTLQLVVEKYGAIEGGKQHLTRLAEHLPKSGAGAGAAAGKPFTITRVFAAPRDLVVKAWTERDQLAKWFGPKGVEIVKSSLDLRVGGAFHYAMKAPDGNLMWGRWTFQELALPERMVFVSSFSDPQGGLARAPFLDGKFPLEVLSTVIFSDHAGIGRGTVVTLEAVAIRASAEEIALFGGMYDSMRGGWTGTLERLEAHLSAAPAATR